jgi:hypothetical protein
MLFIAWVLSCASLVCILDIWLSECFWHRTIESTPKCKNFCFQLFYPLPPKGGTIEYQQVKKSPLGDLGVKILFGVDSTILFYNQVFVPCPVQNYSCLFCSDDVAFPDFIKIWSDGFKE